MKKLFVCTLCIVVFLLSACGVPEEYTQAQECFAAGDYKQAADLFALCSDYKDSADMALESKYLFAAQELDNKEYYSAQQIYKELSEANYKDSEKKLEEVDFKKSYDAALDYLGEENYTSAYREFKEAGDYLDAEEYLDNFTEISVLKTVSAQRTDNFGKTISITDVYNYDEQGQLLYVIGKNSTLISESPLIHAWQYNATHSCLANAEIYEYDDSGRVVGITGLFGASKLPSLDIPSGTKGYVVCFEYDSQGRISKEFTTTGTDQGTVILNYSENGELASAQLDRDSTPYLYFYYNENGDISKVVSNANWYCEYNFNYIYNDDGTVAERDVSVSAGSSYKETYKYDNGRVTELNVDYADENTLDFKYSYSYSDIVIYQDA